MYDGAGGATIYGRNDLLAAGLARLGASPKQAEGGPPHRGMSEVSEPRQAAWGSPREGDLPGVHAHADRARHSQPGKAAAPLR